MRKYIVTILDGTGDNFVNVNRYDPAAVIEFAGFDDEGREVYEIETAHNLDSCFAYNDSVSYTFSVS